MFSSFFFLLTVGVVALPEPHTTTSTVVVTVSAATSSLTISTSVPSPTAPLTSNIPSQAPLPPNQTWCPSEIFCAGSLLQIINLAGLYADPKVIVDKPTNGSAQAVIANFQALSASSITEGDMVNFVNSNFQGEGLELEPISLPKFNPNPAFLNKISDPLVKSFAQTVHGFWPQLARQTKASTLCTPDKCESSLIPLNHTFVVPGGRFREQYYWDSFFIMEGLLKSELFDIANSTLQNFMDELEKFGFIPNGGRIYYLNRSQPPLFIHMLFNYVNATNDCAILKRALPLADKEINWWKTHRTINVTSPYTQQTYEVARYAVNNSAPRPESYLQDYQTANGGPLDSAPPTFTEPQKWDLYAELASGAETGWDFSSRFISHDPNFEWNSTNTNVGLRSLKVREIIPVDLNSILYNAFNMLAHLYDKAKADKFYEDKCQCITKRAAELRADAEQRRAAILDLFWDPNKLAFYDYNTTSSSRGTLYSPATFYPLWARILPQDVVGREDKAFGMFAGLNMVLNKYNGTLPATFLTTGLQWDCPNTWPPHQYIALQALQSIDTSLRQRTLPTPSGNETTFDLVPAGQLGIEFSQLPVQTIAGGFAFPHAPDVNKKDGTVVNGGNAGGKAGKGGQESWADVLERELSNRYVTSALCSWHATGGELPGFPRLSPEQLNITLSVNNTGNMFEKFSLVDTDSAGRGGEYTVQAGFGWTNGVLIWISAVYGDVLTKPECPPLIPLKAA